MIPTATRADSSSARSTWTVVYDGDCGLCRTLLALLLRADRDRRLRPVALRTPEADALLSDLDRAAQDASWHLVDPAGRRTSAGAALPPLLGLLPAGAVPGALLRRIPRTTERAYRLVADHRDRLGPLIPDGARRRATALVARRSAADDPRSVSDDPRSPTDDPRSVSDDSRSPTDDPRSPTDDPRSVLDDPRSPTDDPRSATHDPRSPTDDDR